MAASPSLKERLEVFASGKVMRLDNYRKLKAWGIPGFTTRRSLLKTRASSPLRGLLKGY